MKKQIVFEESVNFCEECQKNDMMFFENNILHNESGYQVNVYRCKFCQHIQTFLQGTGNRLQKVIYL